MAAGRSATSHEQPIRSSECAEDLRPQRRISVRIQRELMGARENSVFTVWKRPQSSTSMISVVSVCGAEATCCIGGSAVAHGDE